jgi:two-component system chemotaxis response regulator CheY
MAYNVLIVDDSSVIRKTLIKAFGLTDIAVNHFYEAGNGKEGLEVLAQHWIDVIFLDINMPVMNGMEFMHCLRDNQAYKDTPIIVVSTEGSEERRSQLMQAGVKAYLRKPVTPEDLVQTILTVLGAEGEQR